MTTRGRPRPGTLPRQHAGVDRGLRARHRAGGERLEFCHTERHLVIPPRLGADRRGLRLPGSATPVITLRTLSDTPRAVSARDTARRGPGNVRRGTPRQVIARAFFGLVHCPKAPMSIRIHRTSACLGAAYFLAALLATPPMAAPPTKLLQPPCARSHPP